MLCMLSINSPVVDMRQQPLEDSEVVSQAYYSEQVQPLEEVGEWLKVQTVVDGYPGWIPKKVVYPYSSTTEQVAKVVAVSAHLYHVKDTVYGPKVTLPFESQLEVIDASEPRWITVKTVDGNMLFIQRGDLSFDTDKTLTMDEMLTLSERFLERPYTWGGRSSFGYDCSGFTQMLYRQMKIMLPRDSKDQMNYEGFTEVSLEALQPGDLIFWGLAEDKIRHVGLYLGNDTFIHATVGDNRPTIHKSTLSASEWNGSGRYQWRTFRTLINKE